MGRDEVRAGLQLERRLVGALRDEGIVAQRDRLLAAVSPCVPDLSAVSLSPAPIEGPGGKRKVNPQKGRNGQRKNQDAKQNDDDVTHSHDHPSRVASCQRRVAFLGYPPS
jgi:hypothetical protein